MCPAKKYTMCGAISEFVRNDIWTDPAYSSSCCDLCDLPLALIYRTLGQDSRQEWLQIYATTTPLYTPYSGERGRIKYRDRSTTAVVHTPPCWAYFSDVATNLICR